MYGILICDDEKDIRAALRIYLTGEQPVPEPGDLRAPAADGVCGWKCLTALCTIQRRKTP